MKTSFVFHNAHQLRSQGHSFGGGGNLQAPKARDILEGSGGMLPWKF